MDEKKYAQKDRYHYPSLFLKVAFSSSTNIRVMDSDRLEQWRIIESSSL